MFTLDGASRAVAQLKNEVSVVASTEAPLTIHGEPGSGKRRLAQIIHQESGRPGKFVPSNLSAIVGPLAESELFGHIRSSFAGAVSDSPGIVRTASSGTLYLEDIDQTPPRVQAHILRLLQDKVVRPVGTTQDVSVEVRVIASFTRSLDEIVRAGLVRRDLLYRLGVVSLRIPPLRNRPEDIPVLTECFLDQVRAAGREVELSPAALRKLQGHHFPGNVKELRDVVTIAAMTSTSNVIEPSDLRLIEAGSEPVIAADDAALRSELRNLRRELSHAQHTGITASPIWEGRRFPTRGDCCFVLMPFADVRDLQAVYRNHVKPVIEGRCGLRCERADDLYGVSGVMQSVWEGVNYARLLIADLTERNPNVFYELGIAHTLGKPVIMLTQSMDYVPFDLRHLRCIVYDYKPGRIEALESALEKTVSTVLATTSSEQAPDT